MGGVHQDLSHEQGQRLLTSSGRIESARNLPLRFRVEVAQHVAEGGASVGASAE